jgi:uncharacterized protein YwgA
MELKTLVAYLAKHTKIKGKKALQKLVYFCTEMGIPVNCSFRMYLYGPYSDELAEEIGDFIHSDILCIENDGYTFTCGTACDDCCNEQELEQYKEKIDKVIGLFSGFRPMMLELYATVHFIAHAKKQINGSVEEDEVVNDVLNAKGSKFGEQEIRNAYKKLVEWNMIG